MFPVWRASAGNLALALVLPLLAGCLTRNVAEPVRYFRPASPPEGAAARRAPAGAEQKEPLRLRLRKVDSAEYLKTLMARRASDVEVWFGEYTRWTEPPAGFVERALRRELFEARGIARAESLSAAHLDVEVRAFEEAFEPKHAAVVVLWCALDGPDGEVFERRFSARRPIAGSDPTLFARAIGAALDEAVAEIGAAVEAGLRQAAKGK